MHSDDCSGVGSGTCNQQPCTGLPGPHAVKHSGHATAPLPPGSTHHAVAGAVIGREEGHAHSLRRQQLLRAGQPRGAGEVEGGRLARQRPQLPVQRLGGVHRLLPELAGDAALHILPARRLLAHNRHGARWPGLQAGAAAAMAAVSQPQRAHSEQGMGATIAVNTHWIASPSAPRPTALPFAAGRPTKLPLQRPAFAERPSRELDRHCRSRWRGAGGPARSSLCSAESFACGATTAMQSAINACKQR